MGSRSNRGAVHVAPLFLRLALGVTFIWAGLSKILPREDVDAQDAAILASMGVLNEAPAPEPASAPVAPPSSRAPEGTQGAWLLAAWRTHSETQPDAPPSSNPAGDPASPAPASPATDAPITPPATSIVPPTALPPTVPPSGTPLITPPASPATPAAGGATQSVRRLHASLSLTIYRAAFPAPRADGSSPIPLWPEAAAKGRWPAILAWSVAIGEVTLGAMVLVGLFTRLAAFGLAFIMLGAIWLTTVGPAIQSGDAVLGFLPANKPWDVRAWSVPLWQLALLMSSFSLLFAGSGALALDRLSSSPRPIQPHPRDQEP
ncbi:MAG: DoxX family protein [Planctomycetota bacterium]|nr:DoxX family protein [Planctomycetota bacterium]